MLLALAWPASAQPITPPPFPNAVAIGDGWVPCDHPAAIYAGLGCVPPDRRDPETCVPWPDTPPGGTTGAICNIEDCARVNPYTWRAMVPACIDFFLASHPPLERGQTYYRMTPERRATVLTVTENVQGRPLYLVQWLASTEWPSPGNTGDETLWYHVVAGEEILLWFPVE